MDRRTTDYLTTGLYGPDVAVADEGSVITGLLEPGDLVLCQSSGPLGKIIKLMDGFFTHTAIYVGDGQFVHAATPGVVMVTEDAFADHRCLARARPQYGAERNAAAAAWARGQAARASTGDLVDYGAADLGEAFVILARARLAVWRDATSAISDEDMQVLIDHARRVEADRVPDDDPTSCSGLAWRAYAEGADRPMVPRLVEGVEIEDGLVRSEETGSALEFERLGLGLAKDAIPGAWRLFSTNRGTTLSNAVTPGDLWCSPSVGERLFLTPQYAMAALGRPR